MQRVARSVLLAACAAGILVLEPALPPHPAANHPPGAALAQMLPSESIMINLGSKEERMKKSRTEGPGMKALSSGDPQWCVSCHRSHDRVRAAKARRGRN